MRATTLASCLILIAGGATAQQQSNDDYMARVQKAAPPQVVQDATIIRMNGHDMQTLKEGSNGFTCMVAPPDVPMCADKDAMEWAHAWQSHGPASTSTGFIYMLAGDSGASNTDPYATKQMPDNHWVQTGSHVMIVGAAAKSMTGYPREADPDPTKPYMMWPGTPYEHLMIPVATAQADVSGAQKQATQSDPTNTYLFRPESGSYTARPAQKQQTDGEDVTGNNNFAPVSK